MSLLDRPPHTVTIIPKIRVEDEYGVHYEEDTPVENVPCAVQPYTSGQNNVSGVKIKAYGTQVKTGYTILTRGVNGVWPGGPASIIIWRGERYQQDGEAQLFSMTPRTWHFQVGMIKEQVEMK